MNKKKIYIAGKVTGCTWQELSFKFGKAEIELQKEGWDVICPLNICEKDMLWDRAMKLCLEALSDCDAIYLLADWQDSPGANVEYLKAKELKLEVLFQNDKTILKPAHNG